MFNFTPLLGAQSTSPASQSLLELDGGIKILVDVGWDEGFDPEKLKELERQISTLSIILLTHATSAHIAAFTHCCKHFPQFTTIPVYATIPVISLGRTLLQDLYASTPLASSIIPTSSLSESAYSFPAIREGDNPNILLQPPTAEEIAGYFNRINPLKYSQPHQPIPSPFSPPLNGLSITAYSAGHTLGGTIWHIQHGLESIVYAVDWNQARENVLTGAAWLGGSGAGGAEIIEQLRRPTALVCSSKGAERVAVPGGRKNRDDLLLSAIKRTIAQGGTVLIPSDSSARVLELAYLLEQTWRTEISGPHADTFKGVKLYLASRNCGATMRYARSMLEWVDEGIVREMEEAGGVGRQSQPSHNRTNSQQGPGTASRRQDQKKQDQRETQTPFDFKHLKLLERRSQVTRMLASSAPRVILASDTSLEWGFSKEVVRSIADDARNLVILTDRVGDHGKAEKGLGRFLWELFEERSNDMIDAGEEPGQFIKCEGTVAGIREVQTAPLVGNEMSIYQQYLARRRQLQNTLQTDGGTTLETSADVVDDASSSTSTTSNDSDAEHQGKALNVSAALSHSRHKLGLSDAELGIDILLRRKGIHDYDVRGKKGREKTFPFVAKRRRGDEFGDVIRPEEYLRAEERDEVDGQDMRDGAMKNETTLGQKRKWDDVVTRGGPGARRMSKGTNKGRKSNAGNEEGNAAKDAGGKQQAAESSEASDSEESDYEPAEATIEGPSKAVVKQETLRLNFRITYVDFSGLHDKQDLRMLIPLIRPRKLILVGGEEQETLALAEDCRTMLGAKAGEGIGADVYTPVVGKLVDASVDTNAWTVKLTRSLVKRLVWQNVKGLGVVALTGRLDATPADGDDSLQENVKKKLKMIKGEDAAALESEVPKQTDREIKVTPILDVIPANMAAATRSVAQPLHVGDLRLADLRKLMQASGHTAEFRGEGTLLIDGAVAVRKSGTGKIEVDGGGFTATGSGSRELEGTFYAVKRKIYEGLAVVAGG
ncbi:hypothetical protein LTR04_003539 [Oleoguttula sp. CCFEE 6159]|nr:hypothetical protein LTR04_003539 [Oleoguttula sp. CCFEE 6159]